MKLLVANTAASVTKNNIFRPYYFPSRGHDIGTVAIIGTGDIIFLAIPGRARAFLMRSAGVPRRDRTAAVGGSEQSGLFPDSARLPTGFKYQADIINVEEEEDLVRQIATLPLNEFEFHGFTGKRRVASFGWRYDFNEREILRAQDVPSFLLPVLARAAGFAGLKPATLQQVLVTEYSSGSQIGWHRDKATFAEVIGISLLAPCRFRFRRQRSDDSKWERASLILEPRSIYLLDGPSRTQWQHSIPPVEQMRYSITFRKVIELQT